MCRNKCTNCGIEKSKHDRGNHCGKFMTSNNTQSLSNKKLYIRGTPTKEKSVEFNSVYFYIEDIKKAIQELKEEFEITMDGLWTNKQVVKKIDKIFGKPLVEDTTSGKELLK